MLVSITKNNYARKIKSFKVNQWKLTIAQRHVANALFVPQISSYRFVDHIYNIQPETVVWTRCERLHNFFHLHRYDIPIYECLFLPTWPSSIRTLLSDKEPESRETIYFSTESIITMWVCLYTILRKRCTSLKWPRTWLYKESEKTWRHHFQNTYAFFLLYLLCVLTHILIWI